MTLYSYWSFGCLIKRIFNVNNRRGRGKEKKTKKQTLPLQVLVTKNFIQAPLERPSIQNRNGVKTLYFNAYSLLRIFRGSRLSGMVRDSFPDGGDQCLRRRSPAAKILEPKRRKVKTILRILAPADFHLLDLLRGVSGGDERVSDAWVGQRVATGDAPNKLLPVDLGCDGHTAGTVLGPILK